MVWRNEIIFMAQLISGKKLEWWSAKNKCPLAVAIL